MRALLGVSPRKSLSPQDCSPLRLPSWLGHRRGNGSLRVPGESAGCTQVRGSGPPEPPTRTPPQNSHNAQASHGPAQPPHRGFVCRRDAQVDADRDRACPCRLQLRLCGGFPQLRCSTPQALLAGPEESVRFSWLQCWAWRGQRHRLGDERPSLRVTVKTLCSLRL